MYLIKKLGQLRYIKNPLQIFRIVTSRVKSIELAINYVCNRASICKFCYARHLREDQKKVFLDENDVKEIEKKYHPAHVNITGGEPMMNPNIYKIIKAFSKSTIVSMVTNGDYLVSGDYVKNNKLRELKKAGLNTIQISYGTNYNMKSNEILAKACKNKGLNVCLSVTNIYQERDNIKNAIRIAEKEKYHVLYNTPGCSLEDQFDYQLYFTYRNHSLVREDNLFWNSRDTCPAGVQKFYISADKSLYPCDRMTDKKYESYDEMRKEFSSKRKVYCRRYEQMCEECNK